jgi:hypothetical protein
MILKEILIGTTMDAILLSGLPAEAQQPEVAVTLPPQIQPKICVQPPPLDQWISGPSENMKNHLNVRYTGTAEGGRFEFNARNIISSVSAATADPARAQRIIDSNHHTGYWKIEGCTFLFWMEKGATAGRWTRKTNGNWIGKMPSWHREKLISRTAPTEPASPDKGQ